VSWFCYRVLADCIQGISLSWPASILLLRTDSYRLQGLSLTAVRFSLALLIFVARAHAFLRFPVLVFLPSAPRPFSYLPPVLMRFSSSESAQCAPKEFPAGCGFDSLRGEGSSCPDQCTTGFTLQSSTLHLEHYLCRFLLPSPFCRASSPPAYFSSLCPVCFCWERSRPPFRSEYCVPLIDSIFVCGTCGLL
jgi:hypothetical protein